MSKSRDYIPRNALDFSNFVQNLLDYVNAHKAAWGVIPAGQLADIESRFAVFRAVMEASMGPHNSSQTVDRREAQAAVTAALRLFVNQYLRFPPVTDGDRTAMCIPSRGTVRTNHYTVTEKVAVRISRRELRELAVAFRQLDHTGKARPTGYTGAVLIWEITAPGAPAPELMPPALRAAASTALIGPASLPSGFTHHTLAGRTPFTLSFSESDRGKTVYLSMAWQNRRGFIGEWSSIINAVIP